MTSNKATNSAEIAIYGTIGTSWWEESVSASQFSKDLKALGDDLQAITVRINSAGGSVFDGLAIRSLLKNHKAAINVHVDGWAASIASIIAMAGDTITMATGSMMMIHNPMNSLWGGQAKDFREMADVLDKIRDSIVSVYAAKTGKAADELITLMDAETWMSAEEAVEMGFADEVEAGTAVAASMMGAVAMVNGVQMDYSRFINTPNLPQAAAIKPTTTAPVAQTNQATQEEDNEPMDMEQLKAKHPDLYEQVLNAGVSQERTRITELNDLAEAPGGAEIAAEAIKNGTSPAEAFKAYAKASKQRVASEGEKRVKDSDASNAAQVPAADPLNVKPTEEQEAQAHADGIVDEIKKLQGGRK